VSTTASALLPATVLAERRKRSWPFCRQRCRLYR